MSQALERFKQTGKHTLPQGVPQQIMQLLRSMPGPLERERKDAVKYEGPWHEYREWESKTVVRVGYPPFQKSYKGREALQYAQPEKRQQIEQALKEMAKLAPKLKRTVDEDAARYNGRISQVNEVIRQYRGELIYALIQTGDDAMLRRAVEEIDKQVRNKQYAAIDLMRYMYLAVFDGYMMLYDQSAYAQASQQLQRVAERADTYQVFRFGDNPPPHYYQPKERNFGEYAFHMVHLLREPEVLEWFQKQVTEPAEPPKPRHGPDFKFTPYNFTMADIRAARRGPFMRCTTRRMRG